MINSELDFLLSSEDKEVLSKDIEENGYYQITDLRKQLMTHLHEGHEFSLIDVDLIIMFDLRTNYKIFITDDEVLTKEQLVSKYELNRFKIDPELLFNNQYIEVINNDYYVFDEDNESRKKHDNIYKTKIYVGKEKWKDFLITFRLMRSLSFITEARFCIKDKTENKDCEKKELNYIDKVLEQVFNNGTQSNSTNYYSGSGSNSDSSNNAICDL